MYTKPWAVVTLVLSSVLIVLMLYAGYYLAAGLMAVVAYDAWSYLEV